MTTATVSTGVTTHGVMSVQFAVKGMTQEEFATKFNELMVEQMSVAIHNLTGESVELEVFGHDLEKLETFEDDDWA